MVGRWGILFVLFSLILGCVPSTKSVVQDYQGVSLVEKDVKSYEVEGIGDEYFSARRDAIRNGVSRAIVEIMGRGEYEANLEIISREILDNRKVIGEISEFNSTHISDRGDKKVVKGIVRVNLKILRELIEKLDFHDPRVEGVSQRKGSSYRILVQEDNRVSDQTSGQLVITRDSPLYGISFLVFIPNDKIYLLDSQEEYKMLIEGINSKLSELGLDYVDFNRIRDLSKKFSLIYEEKSGQSMSVAQMMAQDVKANVYIEADIDIKYELVAGNNVSIIAVGTLKAYDSSTGRGLGVVSFSRPKRTSRGIFTAKMEVITEIASVDLLKLLKSVEEYYLRGIRIDVSVIGFRSLSEERDFSSIIDTLPGLESKRRKSISGDIAEYEITYKGGAAVFVDDLIDVISGHPKYSKVSIDQSANRVIIRIK